LARRETTEEELANVDQFELSSLGEAEKAVLRFTEAFYTDHRAVPASVWAGLRAHYGEAEIVEIAWTVASYIMLGRLIRAFEIPFGNEEPWDSNPRASSTRQ
jgi:alkylhydroperoxidase family enzyme